MREGGESSGKCGGFRSAGWVCEARLKRRSRFEALRWDVVAGVEESEVNDVEGRNYGERCVGWPKVVGVVVSRVVWLGGLARQHGSFDRRG